MARSKARRSFRPKKTGSCPCPQDAAKDKELRELQETLMQQEPRFLLNDAYNNPNDEYIDLESYSEISSTGLHNTEPLLEPSVLPLGTCGVGDQVDELTYQSGGNASSGQPEDSEPNEDSTSFEIRKLNIAETVMSWLDNYGQARGCTLGSHGTSLLINPDGFSCRVDSSGFGQDNDDEVQSSSKSRPDVVEGNNNNNVPSSSSQAQMSDSKMETVLLEDASRILFNLRNDLEPLKAERTQDLNWAGIQTVLSVWGNLMTTIRKRSKEESITQSELHCYVQLSKNMENVTLSLSPLDTSKFSNPVVRAHLSNIQSFMNLAMKWSKELMAIQGVEENNNLALKTSWEDSDKLISTAANLLLALQPLKFAKSILETHQTFLKYPKYEIVLHDVTPTKTASGWMFFGKVELRHVVGSNNDEEMPHHQHIRVHPQDSGLRLTFMSSLPNNNKDCPCIDYGGIFHVVSRACQECAEYYQSARIEISRANNSLILPLIPPSYSKQFGSMSRHEQYLMMEQIIAHIQAAQTLEPTVAAIDEVLRSFNGLIQRVVRKLKRFTRSIPKKEDNNNNSSVVLLSPPEPFVELVVPMSTESNTLLFQTIRRFLALGPMTYMGSSTSGNDNEGTKKSVLNSVHLCLERGINSLYAVRANSNIFSFHDGVQTLFAVSQLMDGHGSNNKFCKRGAALERGMKLLVCQRLEELGRANKESRAMFHEVVSLIDKRMKAAEKCIDIIMRKGTKLGLMVPARTSGVLFSHKHDHSTLIRYSRNSYIRRQAKRLRQSNEVQRHARKYVVELDYEEDSDDTVTGKCTGVTEDIISCSVENGNK